MSLVRPARLELELDVDWLRAYTTKIHFFGLGFIQAKLTDNTRVHFFHPDIPAFVDEPHDHRYDFVSTVLKGRILNTIWRAVPGDSHVMAYESCRQDEAAPKTEQSVDIVEVGRFETNAGSGYHMNSESLHTVRPDFSAGPLITLVEREIPRKDFAKVVRPKNSSPVCPFSRPMSEDDIWKIVEKCIRGEI